MIPPPMPHTCLLLLTCCDVSTGHSWRQQQVPVCEKTQIISKISLLLVTMFVPRYLSNCDRIQSKFWIYKQSLLKGFPRFKIFCHFLLPEFVRRRTTHAWFFRCCLHWMRMSNTLLFTLRKDGIWVHCKSDWGSCILY